ncbi:drug/metabolite transporter (DMT)-like permease [Wenyingzhuangia heitensis]|uniref:Drug/metabolite transporter (DMT)-like permease n=1 Tax=Wenyingzhuangia heitensis TaxID=1487859 RepID=A0ABX0U724_9FLAO|nr:DMT family transporter [Wenyingzhuangia heitensis]NIJ43775.1 drug/metabolite transporter (DMT)-like permease [Wenyingzhuangia heitensis]
MQSSKAILYMIFSVIAFSLMNTVVKYLNDFSAYQIVFFRSIGTLFFTLPLLLKYKIPILGNHKKWLLLRGLAGVISLTCFFQSLNYLALGTAVSLRYTSPIFAAVLASVFLKEKIKPIQWLLFLIAFAGVLIIKGFGVNVNSIGLFFVLLSAVFLGLIFVLIRKIGNSEHPLVIINYFMVMAFVFGGIMSINYWKNPNIIEWLLLLSLGVFGYFGQLYLTKAFQSYETNIIAPLKYLEVVFMILIGAFWFGEAYNLWTLLGVFLIMFGLIYNVYLKRSKK